MLRLHPNSQIVMQSSSLRGPLRLFCFGLAVCCLFGLSVYLSYSLGQYRTMYDNPIYRWRVSIAVALSELRDPPLRGYVAYRSISNYLNQHGLALMEGEASPMPNLESVRDLIYDPDRLEKLFQDASSTPIDYNLATVPIVGSEKGEAAFYYWAFRLFGVHITSLWYFYFLLLAASVLAFFLAFWRSPFCMLLLMLYLAGHLYMVDIASIGDFQTVHNSRFLPVLALLPSMHLMLLALRRAPLRLGSMILASGQTFLLFFVIFSRLEAAWQPVAILAVSALALPFRRLVLQSWHPRALACTAGKALVVGWPAALVVAGGIGFIAYQHVALDPTAYAIETRTHTFWDPLLVGTISASHELTALYGMGESPYSDTMGYFIARKYLVEHNDTTSPIAVVQDGKVIGSFAMHNMGAYEAVLRRVFFEMVRQHPWLVLRAFVYDKPRAELRILSNAPVFYRPGIFSFTVLLAIVSGVIIWALGAPAIRQEHVLTATRVAFLTGMLSLSTTFITPTPDIPDTMLFFLLLLLIVPACAPLLIKAKLRHRSAIITDPRKRRRTRVPSPR
jgi:hypothetical protein